MGIDVLEEPSLGVFKVEVDVSGAVLIINPIHLAHIILILILIQNAFNHVLYDFVGGYHKSFSSYYLSMSSPRSPPLTYRYHRQTRRP